MYYLNSFFVGKMFYEIFIYKFLDKFEIEIIKKRWRNLRDSYKKARNKMTEYIPSGSETPETNKKKDGFRYYDQMEFLNDLMISRP